MQGPESKPRPLPSRVQTPPTTKKKEELPKKIKKCHKHFLNYNYAHLINAKTLLFNYFFYSIIKNLN
jgi:hypothetical protein